MAICALLGLGGIALVVRRRKRPELTAILAGLLIGGVVFAGLSVVFLVRASLDAFSHARFN